MAPLALSPQAVVKPKTDLHDSRHLSQEVKLYIQKPIQLTVILLVGPPVQ